MSAKVNPAPAQRSSDSFSNRLMRQLRTASSAAPYAPESFRIAMCSSTIRKQRHFYGQRDVGTNDSFVTFVE